MNANVTSTTLDPNPGISELASETSELIVDLTGQVQGGFSPLDLAHDRLNSTALSVLGVSSCLNLFTGPVRVLHGIKQIHMSQKLKDYWGEVHGYLKAVRGGVQAAAGAVYIPASVFLTALFFTASKVMMVASNVLTAVGGALLAIGSAIQMIASSINLYHAVNIRRTLEAALEDNTPQEALEIIQETMGAERFNFERALGLELVEKIIEAEPDQAQEVLKKALSAAALQMGKVALDLFLSFAAILLTAAAFAFTGPMAPIILGAIGTALGMVFLILDLQSMVGEMNSPVGKYDSIWVYASAVFSAALVAISLLIATNPLVIVIIGVMSALLLFVHVACMIRIHSATAAE